MSSICDVYNSTLDTTSIRQLLQFTWTDLASVSGPAVQISITFGQLMIKNMESDIKIDPYKTCVYSYKSFGNHGNMFSRQHGYFFQMNYRPNAFKKWLSTELWTLNLHGELFVKNLHGKHWNAASVSGISAWTSCVFAFQNHHKWLLKIWSEMIMFKIKEKKKNRPSEKQTVLTGVCVLLTLITSLHRLCLPDFLLCSHYKNYYLLESFDTTSTWDDKWCVFLFLSINFHSNRLVSRSSQQAHWFCWVRWLPL